MSPWVIYFKERFPLPVYVILVGGLSVSATQIVGGSLWTGRFVCTFVGLMMFFSTLRMMDEVKDYEKDKIANPTRPLPRGILAVSDVERVILMTVRFMLLFGVGLSFFSDEASGVYVFLTLWLWLMYREFYVHEWLEQRQWLYATSHQFVLVPVSLLGSVATDGASLYDVKCWWYVLVVVGAFFSYEISRKLDPKAHVLLRTYRSLYGVGGCFAAVTVTSVGAMLGAFELGMATLLIPSSCLLLLSFAALSQGRHKLVEGMATLNLALHIWSVCIYKLIEAYT